MYISYQVARKFVWKGILGLLIFMLTACGTGSSTNSTGTSNATPTKKSLALSTGKISEFPISTAHGEPLAVTSGPDGNLWFTDFKRSQDQSQADQSLIGRITPGGKVKEFLLPTTNTLPTGITKGPDGNLWFTDLPGKIGHISPNGKNITEFSILTANNDSFGITSNPDGNLWFTEDVGKIGQIEFRHE